MSLLVIDKPSGPSSFAVVKRVRALLSRRGEKIGHGGTLDPFASGVLPICVGEGTKILSFLLDADKAYEAEVRFGTETDTLDRTGTVVAERPVSNLSLAAIEVACASFRGPIEQIPPMFSALKRDGRPLYSYARAGQTLDRQARKVMIHALEVLAFEAPYRAHLRVRCSKGTYIRQLAADLGTRLGFGAHLVELRRTASGPFRIEQAITLEQVAERIAGRIELPWVSLLDALSHLPRVKVSESQALVLARGQRMPWQEFSQGMPLDGPVCAVWEGSGVPVLLAMVERGSQDDVKILRGFRTAILSG